VVRLDDQIDEVTSAMEALTETFDREDDLGSVFQATDPRAVGIDAEQYRHGDGPCLRAAATGEIAAGRHQAARRRQAVRRRRGAPKPLTVLCGRDLPSVPAQKRRRFGTAERAQCVAGSRQEYQFHNCQSAQRNPHCDAIPQLAQTQLDNSGVEYEAFKVLAGASN
jgi:hypothetical protein